MTDRRHFLVGGSSLGLGRLKLGGQAMLAARNEMEMQLIEHNYLKQAPFQTVSLIIRYGEHENLIPEIGKIDTNNLELPVAITLAMSKVKSLSLVQLTEYFRVVMIDVLFDVAANFDLPYDFLDKLRETSGFKHK